MTSTITIIGCLNYVDFVSLVVAVGVRQRLCSHDLYARHFFGLYRLIYMDGSRKNRQNKAFKELTVKVTNVSDDTIFSLGS